MMDDARASTDTTRFFVIAFAITWLALLAPSLAALGVIEGPPEDYFALAPLAIFGPAIAALVCTKREGGRAEVRALLAGLRPASAHVGWYVVALALPGLTYLAGRAITALVDGGSELGWFFLPDGPEQILGMLLVPFGEEIGWRGYALPRLQARHGALRASVMLGALWGLWHIPMLLAVGTPPAHFAAALPYFVAGSVMFTWLHNRTGGSLLAAVLLHAGVHLDNPRDGPPFYLAVASYIGLAALLLALDRRAFQSRATR